MLGAFFQYDKTPAGGQAKGRKNQGEGQLTPKLTLGK
jgi:hypothetical protein